MVENAESSKKPMSVREAGRKGGAKRFQALGREGMAAMGHRGGERSWTSDPAHAERPRLSDADRRRADEIRAKQERGEALTTAEAGFLGGVSRVERLRERE